MRPNRSDIPVPPFPPDATWVGDAPAAVERLTAGGPLLVHFFEVGELSSVRSLGLVDGWARRYAAAGLVTVGVHSPRSDLARAPEALAAALGRLGVSFPVCSDSDYRVWHAYGCRGWPSLFLWAQGGRLTWFHLGIADLAGSERAIREQLLAAEGDRELPEALAAEPIGRRKLVKPSDEVFPGGAHDRPWSPAPGEPLQVEYAGAGAWAAMDGAGTVTVSVDAGSTETELEVDAPGLYELSEHERHGMHEVRLDFDGSIRVWSVAFAAGPA